MIDRYGSARRDMLRLGLTMAALPAAGMLAPARAQAAVPGLTLGWSFIAKKPEVSDTQLLQDYESRHALGAAPVFARLGIVHYERNYVRRAIGTRPAFDVVSEFGSRPGATRPSMCGKPNDPNWSSSHVMPVREQLVAGAALPFLAGPVLKRAVLLRRPVDATPERFAQGAADLAQAAAVRLGPACRRISLYVQSGPIEDVLACRPVESVCEGALMFWPREHADLPDAFDVPASVSISSIIDLEAFATRIA